MSCSGGAGAGAFVKLSIILRSWVFLSMSLNGNLPGINGRLTANFKMKKGKETLHSSNCVSKWRIKLLFIWLFGVVAIAIWLFLSFNCKTWGSKVKIQGYCNENTSILQQYFNVSKNHFQDLSSLFFESDQVLCSWFLKLLLLSLVQSGQLLFRRVSLGISFLVLKIMA